MEMDRQGKAASEHSAGCGSRRRCSGFPLGMLLVALVSVPAALGFLRYLRDPESATPVGARGAPAEKDPTFSNPRNFRDWPGTTPDLVLLLSGQQHGYLQPCGCSPKQLGGLERRYNLLKDLKQHGWPVVAVDLGDVPQKPNHQTTLKYATSMNALRAMDYAAVGVGQRELELPLMEALANYSLNNRNPPVISATVLDKETDFPGMLESWKVVSARKDMPAVGVVSAIGPSIVASVKQRDPSIKFADKPPNGNEKVLGDSLRQMQAKQADFLVLLYHGTLAEAEACAKRFPQFRVILVAADSEEPSGSPEKVVGETLLISVGHKGRYVGLVGAFRTANPDKPFDLKYQLVALGDEYETPPGAERNNPVVQLMEEYTKEVKRGNYLAKYAGKEFHDLQLVKNKKYAAAKFVGSDRCQDCHPHAYKVWENSGHAHAYAKLENAKKPALRQFDGECVQCHVIGFGYMTGFQSEQATPKLLNVGCESCHGPGSAHVNNPANLELRALMNPFKTPPNESPEAKTRRINSLDLACQKCHDHDNDNTWSIDKWEKIKHYTPKE